LDERKHLFNEVFDLKPMSAPTRVRLEDLTPRHKGNDGKGNDFVGWRPMFFVNLCDFGVRKLSSFVVIFDRIEGLASITPLTKTAERVA
jgi:hypothetical protein